MYLVKVLFLLLVKKKIEFKFVHEVCIMQYSKDKDKCTEIVPPRLLTPPYKCAHGKVKDPIL